MIHPRRHASFVSFTLALVGLYDGTASSAAAPPFNASCEAAASGNPFVDGWYADPDIKIYNDQYWLYPTYSAPYEQQTFLDAFSSPDLIHWTKHDRVLDRSAVSWANRAIWAPSPIFRNGTYYLYFGANDIQNNSQLGGIGVATASRPEGPYRDPLGRPLIGSFVNGAQPIDQNVFIDDDGKAYIYYGGWGHCNVARLNNDMTSLGTLPNGSTFQEITPEGYVEGPLMFKRKGVYYLMWSEGAWTGPNYRVSYAMASSPLGPFQKQGTILSQNSAIGTGSGHNTVVNVPGSDQWYIFYHRHPLGETDGNHRVLSFDTMAFNADGTIKPVLMQNKDRFCDGNNLGWTSYGAAPWTVASEEYRVSVAQASNSLQNNNFASLSYEADVALGGTGTAGVLFRASRWVQGDGYRGYYVGLDADTQTIFVRKSDGTQRLDLASAPFSLPANVRHHLRVNASGPKIEVFANGSSSPLLSVQDSSYSAGATGLRAFNSTAAFDNIAVQAAQGNPGAMFFSDGAFGGTGISLPLGAYTLYQIADAGILNDSISSIQMPAGWVVQVFEHDNFQGRSWTFTGDVPYLPAEANDQASSIRIYRP